MEKSLKLLIEVENSLPIGVGIRSKIDVIVIWFTDVDFNPFEYEDIAKTLREALKMSKGFEQISFFLTERQEGESHTFGPALFQYRFVCDRSGKITGAQVDSNNMFKNWLPAQKKNIYKVLENSVIAGNKRFVELETERLLSVKTN